MPSKECSLKRGKGGSELAVSPTGAPGIPAITYYFPFSTYFSAKTNPVQGSCSDALIFQSHCSLCSKSVQMEVQVGFTRSKEQSCVRHDSKQSPQAKSTEFSDFSRGPTYCQSCTGVRLEVCKFFHNTSIPQWGFLIHPVGEMMAGSIITI